jgi:hypothetical protein
MEGEPREIQDEADEEDRITLAIFPVSQYLGDARLRKTVMDRASSGNLKPADAQVFLPFHPLSMEALKQVRDADVYCLLGIHGILVRTHVVLTNGIARTNPPPEDYLCDSCHAKGWLKKEFQDSKIDGANIPVWLCAKCSKLKPEERDVRF